MTDLEIFFMVLSLAMAFAASLFAYDCRRKEEEINLAHTDFTESWVAEKDIISSLRCLPQYLN